MRKASRNVVILTHGWTGSSVFAALMGRAGCWLGSETVVKTDYDTFENADLVAWNRRLLAMFAPQLDHEHHFEPADVTRIERAAESLDLQPLREFVARCQAHGSFVWKDPRLTWTIRIWARVLDLERTDFLVLTREDLQAWISANARRHVQSWSYTRKYNHGITESNSVFVRSLGRPVVRMSFEDLLLEPEDTLARLNTRFGLAICLSDLMHVCREPLYRRSRGWLDLLQSTGIYVKNFGERDGRRRNRPARQTSSAASSL